jgi:hypothetical protein
VPAKAGNPWSPEEADLQSLDLGTRGRVKLLIVAYEELTVENRRFRHLIVEGVPVPTETFLSHTKGDPDRISAVRINFGWSERFPKSEASRKAPLD